MTGTTIDATDATVASIISAACAKLQSPTKLLDVEILLSHVLQKDRVFLKTWPEYVVAKEEQDIFFKLLTRRIAGEPIAYIIGKGDFWDFTLQVNNSLLIPRAETEHLVEVTLNLVGKLEVVSILELGTGSGAVACALAKSIAGNSKILALDNSKAALVVAANNAANLGLQNITFLQSDWFSALTSEQHKFSHIVSNPPYIAAGDPELSPAVLQYEPRQALLAADNGYAELRHIINNAHRFLLPSGWLVLEHGHQQGEFVRHLLEIANFIDIFTTKDLAGKERISAGRLL